MTDFYNLDLPTLTEDIKNYVSENSTLLKDYNYEGSVINELTKMLAFITQYQLFYLNMNSNEYFLSTAQIEANVYKIANMLNYIPKRKNSPYIDIDLKSASSSYTLTKYEQFISSGGYTLYYLDDDVTLTNLVDSNVRLYSGTIGTQVIDFSKGYTDSNYAYITLSDNNNIDNTFLFVTDIAGNEWNDANRNSVTTGGKFYFIDYSTGAFKIVFDDGKMFYPVIDNDETITFTYLYSTGTINNGVDIGTVSAQSSSIVVSTTTSSILGGGSDEDTIESIKLKAPLFYNTNHRAVSEKDHNTLITNYGAYDTFNDLYIWGGDKEYVDTNKYLVSVSGAFDKGYIYYSGLLTDNSEPTTTDRSSIESYIDSYRMISLLYRFISPVIHYINSTINIKYNLNITDSSISDIQDLTNTYIETNFNGFNSYYRKSELINYIDGLEGVDYVYIDSTSCISGFGFTASPTNIIRLNNDLDASITFDGYFGAATISSSGSALFVGGATAGTISTDSEYGKSAIYIINGELTGQYTFSLQLDNYEYIVSKKETYLQHNISYVKL